ncbi:hypothetical protein [Parabacteroides distasonis]|uniref:hypothetical protein n=1 Tax=Parabacteroides distasonis TaxID=823 RepID=UPI00155E708A|nr:hypothetical protein [Parabacteroides distasonis]
MSIFIRQKSRAIRNTLLPTGRFIQYPMVFLPNIRKGHGAGRMILSRWSSRASAASISTLSITRRI